MTYIVKAAGYDARTVCETKEEVLAAIKRLLDLDVRVDIVVKVGEYVA